MYSQRELKEVDYDEFAQFHLSGESVHQSDADRRTKIGITFLLSEWYRNCSETIEFRFQCCEFEVDLVGD